ncbi:MAG: hypothetical protein J7K23_03630 [Thermoproteales archaeon]|nr:hypothetical protein [Thermoproteales archaeon]
MKTLPVILLLGLIIMFEFIPSVIATTKIFSQSNIPFLLGFLIGSQISIAILSATCIFVLWKNYKYSKVFTLIVQYLTIGIPLAYISLLSLGLLRYNYIYSGAFFLMTFSSSIAGFLAFVNVIILGIILGREPEKR